MYLCCAGGLEHPRRTQLKSIGFSAAAIFDTPEQVSHLVVKLSLQAIQYQWIFNKLIWKRFAASFQFILSLGWFFGWGFFLGGGAVGVGCFFNHLHLMYYKHQQQKTSSLTLQICWRSWGTLDTQTMVIVYKTHSFKGILKFAFCSAVWDLLIFKVRL